MPGQVTVRLDTRPLTALLRAMPGRTRLVVRRNAFLVRDRARANAHVITGSMRDSIYVSMGGGDSTYAADATTARGDNPHAIIEPEQTPSRNRASAIVGVAVQHGVYEETRMGHMFLLPAAESVRPAFIADASRHIVF